MRDAGYSITENDPFEEKPAVILREREISPYVNRIRMHWAEMRNIVLENVGNRMMDPVITKVYSGSFIPQLMFWVAGIQALLKQSDPRFHPQFPP